MCVSITKINQSSGKLCVPPRPRLTLSYGSCHSPPHQTAAAAPATTSTFQPTEQKKQQERALLPEGASLKGHFPLRPMGRVCWPRPATRGPGGPQSLLRGQGRGGKAGQGGWVVRICGSLGHKRSWEGEPALAKAVIPEHMNLGGVRS